MKALIGVFYLCLSPALALAGPFGPGVAAAARPSFEGVLHEIDFKPGKAGLRAAKLSEEALKAVPRLIATPYANENDAAGCSAAFISDDGLLVTASHCVEMCGEDLSKCSFTLDGKRIMQPFAVHTQSCLTQEAFNQKPGCDNWRDVAVLKIENPASDFRCFPLARQDIARKNAAVVQIGYPQKTTRFNKRGLGDAPGFHEIAQVSIGKTVKSNTCVVTSIGENYKRFAKKKQLHPMIGGQQPIHWTALAQLPRMIQHTASINHGNSGGPTLNEKAEIVGVLSLIGLNMGFEDRNDELESHNEIECEGNALTEPTLELHEILAKDHLEARCEERSVSKK